MDSSDVPVIETSQWPLPRDGRRIVVPQALIQTLGAHPLCGDCLPHGVGYYPRAAGHQMGRASPRDHLLIYCVAGRGEVDLGGDTHPVGPGDVLLFREGQPHRYRARPD
ncbi:MAG TPA: AraC family transcriptional regulator, partial [Alcanivorax sp.]|nr:AraC family transcriptional regulator [Alcanivorax sp.]